MKGYVYDVETLELIEAIEGDDDEAIESAFSVNFDTDSCGLTYSPAFGFKDGLK